jgi:uncharacterized protein (TIGR02466 family)
MNIDIFSCPILHVDAPMNIEKLHNELNADWQSIWVRGEFEEDSELFKLKNFISDRAHSYFKDCGFLDIELRTSNVWYNDKGLADFIQPHHHGMTLVSWVYYLTVGEDTGDIVFVDPKGNNSWSYFTLKEIDPNKVNGMVTYKVHPKPNQLIIFPGWLEHYVEPNKSNTIIRRSLSGDLHTKEFVDYYDNHSIYSKRDLHNHTVKPKDQLK